MSSEPFAPPQSGERYRGTGIKLLESDFADVEQIRQHFDLDTFSQALRRAIRLTVRQIADTKSETADAA